MSGEQILIVDDDPRLRELVRYTLDRAGFVVREAADGRAALASIIVNPPQLVLLDVLMPGLSGLDVCRELRRTSDVPVIFLTSRDEEIDCVLGLELGGDDYVTKPFLPNALVSRIRAVLRRYYRNPAPLSVLEGGGVRLDLKAHRAWAAGSILHLTVTEFRMVQAFLTRIDQVITRRELQRAAYDGPHAVSDRTLISHVRGIRQKLRACGLEPIETVYGVGYLWSNGA